MKIITAVATEPEREDVPNKLSGIYKITCTANSKVYIGSAINIRKRWNNHIEDLKKQKHYNSHLQKAWNKYGAAAFKFSVICFCKPDNLIKLEQKEIDKHDATNQEIGFNLNPVAGSNLGRTYGIEYRQKISERRRGKCTLFPEQIEELRQRMIGNKYLLGHVNMPETTEKLKRARAGKQPALGMRHTEESKKKIGMAFKGKNLSLEHCEKISAAHKGKKQSAEHRLNLARVQSKLSAEQVETARRLKQQNIRAEQIAEMFNVSRATIYNAINGKYQVYREMVL